MRSAFACFVAAAAIGSASAAQAQYFGPYGGYYGNSTWYSSTPYEGARRGEAAWIEAYGRFLEHQARAAQSWHQAERERLLNRRLVWQGHREREMTERQERAQRQREARRRNAPPGQAPAPVVAREDEGEAAPDEAPREVIEVVGPARLTRDELSETGAIRWPDLLQDPRFDAARSRIESLFADRAARGCEAPSRAQLREIDATARALAVQLRAVVRNAGVGDYTLARGFVRRLAAEARFPQGQMLLADDAASH
jgi:hypothetical protein